MKSLIPLNGRIAIVDDKIGEALPLMKVLSLNRIPYTYYSGKPEDFPNQTENDIRILFLDLNLNGEGVSPNEIIKSLLYSTIKRIISPNNYPYLLILWSIQEANYLSLLEELFEDALKDRKPIAIKSYAKSDVIPASPNGDSQILYEKLYEILQGFPAYGYLLQWENHVHNSADRTIQEVFHDYHSQENWENNANCIMTMFAKSFLEKRFENSSEEKKARASLLFLNDVYQDTLEANIANAHFLNAVNLTHNVSDDDKKDIAAKINNHLLLSNQYESVRQPGCVICLDPTDNRHILFNDSFNTRILSNSDARKIKREIYSFLLPCDVIVTPACDYAQDKIKNDRIVQGIIIDANYDPFIDKSEAIYTSPKFSYQSRNCILVLNFRFFFTSNLENVKIQPMFRLRNTVLAEIQSKLARHINRQGIMNL